LTKRLINAIIKMSPREGNNPKERGNGNDDKGRIF
jgi:hypothetical protein